MNEDDMKSAASSPVAPTRSSDRGRILYLCCSLVLVLVLMLNPWSSLRAGEEGGVRGVEFQGLTWVASEGMDLSLESYRGHEALKIQSRQRDAAARVGGLKLMEGRIELDLALAGRIPPWFCFQLEGDGGHSKMRLNPWPKSKETSAPRLRQAVLTRNESSFLVINYRQSVSDYDPLRWTRIAIESNDGLCRIYIDHDKTPAVTVDLSLGGSAITIEGSCYIRNLNAMPRDRSE